MQMYKLKFYLREAIFFFIKGSLGREALQESKVYQLC